MPTEIETKALALGDRVRTIKGAKFEGVIIAFDNDPVSPGCTVRADHPLFDGTKHVYPLVQLAALDSPIGEQGVEPLQHGLNLLLLADALAGRRFEAINVDVAVQQLRAADAFLSALSPERKEPGWRTMESAPSLERVVVAGWQKRSGNVVGYWWYHEDATDGNGRPIDHPEALLWIDMLAVLPPFPATPGQPT